MSYLTRWLTKSDMTRIENIEDLPHAALTPDEGPDGKLDGGFAANVINRVHPAIRSRADFAIQKFCEEK